MVDVCVCITDVCYRKMDNLLIPDTPAGRRSNDATGVEASCCSPIRLKFKTFPIKVFDLVYFICGIVSIALGIAACVFGCQLNGLSIPAGIMFIVTASVGEFTRNHGIMSTIHGFLNLFCFVWSVVLMVAMLAILPEGESTGDYVCSSYDCNHWRPDNCCEEWRSGLEWKKVGIDLGILVVGVVVMVTSVLATTLNLRNVNWVTICCLKKNMNENESLLNSTEVSSNNSSASSAMKRCWKPFDSKEHRKATITCSIIHIILGVISAGLGITAVFVGCQYAHIGIPIWTGLLIFVVTGIFGLLSVKNQGLYIPCFFALSILSFLLSINMFTWFSLNIWDNDYEVYGCIDWSCDHIYPTYYPYHYDPDHCYDCLPGCCSMGDLSSSDTNLKISIDAATIVFGVLESLVCIVTIGLALSQLSCYLCCRSNCNCCQPKMNDQYQMVMAPNGNLMMIPVSNTHQDIPTMVNNQPVIMNPQPMLIPSNQVMNQNQVNTTEGSQMAAPRTGTQHGQAVSVQPGSSVPLQSGQPVFVQGQPVFVQGQPMQGKPVMVQRVGQPIQGKPVMVQRVGQPIQAQGQGHTQPKMAQGQGQSVMGQWQGLPIVVQGQRQPIVGQGQGKPMVGQGHGQPFVGQGQGQPVVVQGKEQPVVVQSQGQPMVVQGQGQPMVVQGQGQPMVVQGQGQPVSVQGQGKPLLIQGQVPFIQQGVEQVTMVPAHGQPTPQLVVYPAQEPPVSVATKGQPINITPKDPPSMITPQGQPPNITPQTQAVIAQAMGGQTSGAEAAADPVIEPGNVSNPVA